MTIDERDGMTLGELGRRMDRLDLDIGIKLNDITRTINERVVPISLWREAEADHERRITENERYRGMAESRFRATILAVLVAVITGVSGILVAALTAHP